VLLSSPQQRNARSRLLRGWYRWPCILLPPLDDHQLVSTQTLLGTRILLARDVRRNLLVRVSIFRTIRLLSIAFLLA